MEAGRHQLCGLRKQELSAQTWQNKGVCAGGAAAEPDSLDGLWQIQLQWWQQQ